MRFNTDSPKPQAEWVCLTRLFGNRLDGFGLSRKKADGLCSGDDHAFAAILFGRLKVDQTGLTQALQALVNGRWRAKLLVSHCLPHRKCLTGMPGNSDKIEQSLVLWREVLEAGKRSKTLNNVLKAKK